LQLSPILEYPLAEALGDMPPTRWIPFLLAFASTFAAEWRPIDPAELAQKTPKVEADSDSEVIFWDVQVEGFTLSHYRRIKVFNTRGRDFWSTVTIPHTNGTDISHIAARTVHPDGSSLELGQNAIRETVDRIGHQQIRNTVFVIPNVEAGSIIEYRWTETHVFWSGMRLDFQLDNVPAQIVRYWIRPSARPNTTMHVAAFNCSPTGEYLAHGVYLASLSNVPALRREPWMPPADQVRAWSLIYFAPGSREEEPSKFWDNYRKSVYSRVNPLMKADKDVRAIADRLTANDRSPEGKVSVLYDYCQSRIRNIDTDQISAEERGRAKKNLSSADTLAHGIGTPDDIWLLFAALASAEGYDVRWALMADRNQPSFDVSFRNGYFLRHAAIAVKFDSGWRFYDPASIFGPHDLITAEREGLPALLCDPREPMFLSMPTSNADQNLERLRASLELKEDGSIEGNLEKHCKGHRAVSRRLGLLGQSDAQRQEAFKREIAAMLSTAEVSDVSIENAGDSEKPLVYRCHVRVAAYAQRAGRRILFVPDVFRQNAKAVFTATTRKNPVYFPYAETEDDEVTIEIPSDFEFEVPRVPAAIRLGTLGEYQVHATIQSRNKLMYTRRFVISQPGGARVPAENYGYLKSLFGAMANADSQMFILRRSVTPNIDHQ
jgi:hypothetical protein